MALERPATSSSSQPGQLEERSSTRKLDFLKEVESFSREVWVKNRCFDAEHGAKLSSAETFYVTFPFPYMNGRLHLGHAFSLTKSEFTARYQRLLGKNSTLR